MSITLISSDGKLKIPIPFGTSCKLGRGDLLKINDKRCSREQMELNVSEDGGKITATLLGINSSFLWKGNKKIEMLRNQPVYVESGDVLSFLMEDFKFMVKQQSSEPIINQPLKRKLVEEQKRDDFTNEKISWKSGESNILTRKPILQKEVIQTSQSEYIKPVCQYGTACYRKNPKHFEEFSHPPSSIEPDLATSINDKRISAPIHKGNVREEFKTNQEEEEEEDRVILDRIAPIQIESIGNLNKLPYGYPSAKRDIKENPFDKEGKFIPAINSNIPRNEEQKSASIKSFPRKVSAFDLDPLDVNIVSTTSINTTNNALGAEDKNSNIATDIQTKILIPTMNNNGQSRDPRELNKMMEETRKSKLFDDNFFIEPRLLTKQTDQQGRKCIAFPSFSTGSCQFSVDRAARIASKVTKQLVPS